MANKKKTGKRGPEGRAPVNQNAYYRSNGGRRKKKKGGTARIAAVIMVVAIICLAALLGLVAYNARIDQLQKERMAQEEAEAAIQAVPTATPEPTISPEELERMAREEAEREAARKEAEEQAAREALYKAHPELRAVITLQLPTGDEVINEDVIRTWLVDNGDGTYTKDEVKWTNSLSTYVTELANRVDTLGDGRDFNATDLGVVRVAGSQYYGWKIDRDKEIEKLKEEINAGKESTREPEYSKREMAKADDNNGIGGNYCEIDASRQHLWIYQNYQVVLETDVVTGLMDQTHWTPEGVYLMFGKEKNATLKGEMLPNGKRSYETPVSYWMPFTDTGIGLHDAYWKSVFGYGENWYNGSHGCVNLPAEIAGSVYDLMTTEMPIIVYYSEGYELRPAPASEWDQYLAEQAAAAEQKAQEEADKKDEDKENEEGDQEAEDPTPEPQPEVQEDPYTETETPEYTEPPAEEAPVE